MKIVLYAKLGAYLWGVWFCYPTPPATYKVSSPPDQIELIVLRSRPPHGSRPSSAERHDAHHLSSGVRRWFGDDDDDACGGGGCSFNWGIWCSPSQFWCEEVADYCVIIFYNVILISCNIFLVWGGGCYQWVLSIFIIADCNFQFEGSLSTLVVSWEIVAARRSSSQVAIESFILQ